MENPKMLRCIIYIGYLIHLADCAYHAESGTGTDILYKNEELIPGEKLVSGLYTLELQTDGNLVLYDRRDPMNPSFMIAEDQNPTPIWNTGTVGENVERLVLQRDGNLVLYSDGWVPVWASGTHSPYPYISHLLLSDNGVLGLFCTGNGRLWTNTEGRNESECINERSKLYKNSQLLPGKKLASDNGLYTLEMQADGNLVTYDQNRRAVWSSGTAKLTNVREFLLAGGWHTHEEIMSMSRDDCRNTLIVILHQRNGDSVQALQALSDGDLLERGRRLTPSSRLVLQEDGDLVLYLMGGAAAWRTGTASPWRSVSFLGLGEDGVLTLYCELYSQHHPGSRRTKPFGLATKAYSAVGAKQVISPMSRNIRSISLAVCWKNMRLEI
ncbi:uncharacterized protein [Ptychodera flava]|uniref:uncharacterized protein n=1 Tax=Ptychodera flava TaxID=63121 RepID=UPI00396A0E3A